MGKKKDNRKKKNGKKVAKRSEMRKATTVSDIPEI